MLNAPYQASEVGSIGIHDDVSMGASMTNMTGCCHGNVKPGRRSIVKQDLVTIVKGYAYELVVAVQVSSIG
tara:strand:+ start:4703 stop:4915 length:213 start_codon:yes stop_codon:yes gene_type:complete